MIRTLPAPQSLIIGTFLLLLAGAFAASPLPLVYKSLGILFTTYWVFSVGGPPLAYLSALVIPLIGLIGGDVNWLIMLPIVMTSYLMAVLGLEYAWRYPALIVSPLLSFVPQFIAFQLSQRDLFAINLPWEPASSWVGLHALVALAGSLIVIYFDRRREKLLEANEST